MPDSPMKTLPSCIIAAMVFMRFSQPLTEKVVGEKDAANNDNTRRKPE
jgi:hypothetical protein